MMLSRCFALSFIALISGLSMAPARCRAGGTFPAVWRKTMTDDPGQNLYLQRYSVSLADKKEEAVRRFLLVRALSQGCRGASMNRTNIARLIAGSKLKDMRGAELKKVSDDVSVSFDYFDYQALAHLCSGIGFLFRPKGALGHDLMKVGTGEPSLPYDPANPDLRVPPLRPDDF